MGLKLGDFSPLAGVVSGKGAFGKGFAALGDALGPMAGIAPRVAKSARDRNLRKSDARYLEDAGAELQARRDLEQGGTPMRKGGKVKKMAKGGSTASKRADGCATKGKTKGKMV